MTSDADSMTAEQAELLGREVYRIMDGEEWSSDTLQSIADFAALRLGLPFREVSEDE